MYGSDCAAVRQCAAMQPWVVVRVWQCEAVRQCVAVRAAMCGIAHGAHGVFIELICWNRNYLISIYIHLGEFTWFYVDYCE